MTSPWLLAPLGIAVCAMALAVSPRAPVHHAGAGSSTWAGDAERPWNQEWASWRCARRQRFARVSAPVAQGAHSYEFTVKDGDDAFGERCELAQGNPTHAGFPLFREGQDRWIAFQVYLPPGFPSRSHYSTGIAQWKQTAMAGRDPDDYGGVPVLGMEVRDGRFGLLNSTTNSSGGDLIWLWRGPARRERWVRFTLHVMFSPSPRKGFIELYGALGGSAERLLMRRRHTWTMKRDRFGAIPSHARLGIYRNPRVAGTEHLYIDGYTVAATRIAAEGNAFAPRTRP